MPLGFLPGNLTTASCRIATQCSRMRLAHAGFGTARSNCCATRTNPEHHACDCVIRQVLCPAR